MTVTVLGDVLSKPGTANRVDKVENNSQSENPYVKQRKLIQLNSSSMNKNDKSEDIFSHLEDWNKT